MLNKENVISSRWCSLNPDNKSEKNYKVTLFSTHCQCLQIMWKHHDIKLFSMCVLVCIYRYVV